MKKIYFISICVFLCLCTHKLQAQDISDGYLWVAIADSSALPISSTQTANAELNAIFEEYQVTNYFYRFDYPFGFDEDSEQKMQIYEIHYDNRSDDERTNTYSELHFSGELNISRLFTRVFNFPVDNARWMVAHFVDSSAFPISDTRSASEDVNAILEEFDVTAYEMYAPMFYYNSLYIRCNGDIIDLCVRLAELDTIFRMFDIWDMSYPYGTSIPKNSLKNWSIYPNPFKESISIENADIQHIEIYNMSGKLVYTQDSGNFGQISLAFLSDGAYILKMKSTKNNVLYHKIIKGGL